MRADIEAQQERALDTLTVHARGSVGRLLELGRAMKETADTVGPLLLSLTWHPARPAPNDQP